MPDPKVQLKSAIKSFYRAIDQMTETLAKIHSERMKCAAGCAGCCVDHLSVFEVEADHIRTFAGTLEGEASANACAFLDSGGRCRIYEVRPYVCRTQGLPLRWFEDDVEFRDICPLNLDGSELSSLSPEECWTIGHPESILRDMNDGQGRISLRDLFEELKSRPNVADK